jgi:hypothetical protein
MKAPEAQRPPVNLDCEACCQLRRHTEAEKRRTTRSQATAAMTVDGATQTYR